MTDSNTPRIGIIGTGAIAGYYGLMLQRSGLDVRFLVRSGYEQLQQEGMTIHSSSLGTLEHKIQVCQDIEELADCDWLFVTTKTTANTAVGKLLSQLPSSTARVVLLQNGLSNEDELRQLIPAGMSLFAGLCFIFARRTATGQIQHQGGGTINIGYHSGAASLEQGIEQASQLVQLFNAAGVRSQYVDVLQARWQKLVWNVPYNGLSVVLDARTGAMMADPASHALITDLMQEVVDAAAACGCVLPDNTLQAMLKTTAQMADYHPSMYGDYTSGKELELHAIYRAPLAAAEHAGFSMRKTHMLLQQLEFIQRRRDSRG